MTKAVFTSNLENALLAYFTLAGQEENRNKPISWHAEIMADAIAGEVHNYVVDLETTISGTHKHDIANPG